MKWIFDFRNCPNFNDLEITKNNILVNINDSFGKKQMKDKTYVALQDRLYNEYDKAINDLMTNTPPPLNK